MIITAIPTNLFLILYTLFIGFTSSSLFAFAAVTVLFIELMKTLFQATNQKAATIEFMFSLMLLLAVALYHQSYGEWGLNPMTLCVYIQLLDTIGGFIGTFLLARRDFGH